MSDKREASELEEIRERRREALEEELRAPETPDAPVHVEGTSHLEDLVAGGGVVLADFYADWCGPCKMLEPTVEEIAAETDATVAKVDVDAHQSLATEFGVRGVPTLVLFADGEQVEQLVGVKSKETLLELIGRYA